MPPRLLRRTLPVTLVGLVVAALPPLTTAPAQAAPATPWVSVSGPAAFSPNGDGRKDTAKFTIRVKKRATVTVKVVRKGKVVRGPVRLGTRKAGSKVTWTWNGRNAKGRRVADAGAYGAPGYTVKVVAKAVKKQKRASLQKVTVRHAVAVDTDAGLPAAARLVSDSDTVYPNTTVVHDRIMLRLDRWYGVGRATLVLRDQRGRVVHEITSDSWDDDYGQYRVAWDGRGADGRPLDLGAWNGTETHKDVTATLRVTDEVGNVAQTPPLTIRVSSQRLALRTAEVTVGARDTRWTPSPWDCGPGTGNGCADQFPCGEVVASELASLPKGLSYRTQECEEAPGLPARETTAMARHWLDLPTDAVRGGAAVSVEMLGQPTVAGEADTARITVGDVSATSEASSEPTVTTARRGYDIARHELYDADGGFEVPEWKVEVVGDDSYDVGEFTVTYAYLVPVQ